MEIQSGLWGVAAPPFQSFLNPCEGYVWSCDFETTDFQFQETEIVRSTPHKLLSHVSSVSHESSAAQDAPAALAMFTKKCWRCVTEFFLLLPRIISPRPSDSCCRSSDTCRPFSPQSTVYVPKGNTSGFIDYCLLFYFKKKQEQNSFGAWETVRNEEIILRWPACCRDALLNVFWVQRAVRRNDSWSQHAAGIVVVFIL